MKCFSLKHFLLLTLSSVLLITACDKKNTEVTTEKAAADSIKKDSLPVAAGVELAGKSKMVARLWKAIEFETPSVKLSGDLIDIRFDFKNDGSIQYSEDGKKEKGTWKLNEGETAIILELDERKSELDIKELTEDKMVLAGQEHGMYRTYTLAPKK